MRGSSRRAQRTGRFALALLCGTAAAALLLAQLYHLGAAAIVVSVLGGLPGFYLSYAAYRDDRWAEAMDGQLSAAELADQFAGAVQSQWLEEVSVRRVNDPYPLPIRWVPADPVLVDGWSTLTSLANSGAGWSRDAVGWAASPAELAGQGEQLVDVLTRVPTGRLLVLGEPGAGKTILMVRLVLDLLARRKTGDEVPVLFSVASWDPSSVNLRDWLASELAIAHAALIGPAQPWPGGGNSLRLLVDSGLIMPILDGLDEMPDGSRGPAIAKINDAMRAGDRLVVTCRPQAFRDAVTPPDGPVITLRGAAGVELRPLDSSAIATYLEADAGQTHWKLRWQPVVMSLGSRSPVAQVLSNPLMLTLARTIYNPRPGEISGSLPDPAEMCGFQNPGALEGHLLGAFVPAVYRGMWSAPGSPGRWTAQKAGKWLAFLARHLERNVNGPDLAWWQLSRATPRAVTTVTAVLITGLLTGAAVGISFIILFAGLYAFDAYWYAIPTLKTAVLSGVKYAGAAGLASMLVTAAGMALMPHAKLRETCRTSGRKTTTTMAGLGAGLLIGVAAWAWSLLIWAGVAIGGGAAVLVAFVADRADRGGRTIDLHSAATAAVVVGTVAGLTLGIAPGVLEHRLAFGIYWGLGWGCAAGFMAAVGVILEGSGIIKPTRNICWNPGKAIRPAIMAATAATFILVLTGSGTQPGLSFVIISVFASSFAVGAVAGLEKAADDLSAANTSPSTALARDRSASLLLIAVTGVATGFTVAVIAGLVFGAYETDPSETGAAFGIAMGVSGGLAVGLAFCVIVNGFGSAWPPWLIARSWLSLSRRLPLDVTDFLDDAHRRGALRRAGPVYQFRHIELQHYLAREHGLMTDVQMKPDFRALVRLCRKIYQASRDWCQKHDGETGHSRR